MRKIAMTIVVLFCTTVTLLAQGIIRGQVTDSSGAALPGASVKVKGTSRGTTTANDGSFSIQSDTDLSLEISGTGFLPSTVKATLVQAVTVRLIPNSKNLSEVIVTALGISRSKNTLLYAAQKANKEK